MARPDDVLNQAIEKDCWLLMALQDGPQEEEMRTDPDSILLGFVTYYRANLHYWVKKKCRTNERLLWDF